MNLGMVGRRCGSALLLMTALSAPAAAAPPTPPSFAPGARLPAAYAGWRPLLGAWSDGDTYLAVRWNAARTAIQADLFKGGRGLTTLVRAGSGGVFSVRTVRGVAAVSDQTNARFTGGRLEEWTAGKEGELLMFARAGDELVETQTGSTDTDRYKPVAVATFAPLLASYERGADAYTAAHPEKYTADAPPPAR